MYGASRTETDKFKSFNIVTFGEFDNKPSMHFSGVYDVLRDSVWKIVTLLNSFFMIVLGNFSIAKFWCCKNFLLSCSFTQFSYESYFPVYWLLFLWEVKVWWPSLLGCVNITFWDSLAEKSTHTLKIRLYNFKNLF